MQFVGILLQIEELLLAVARMEDVLPLAIGQCVPVVRWTVADIVFQVDPVPPAAALVAHE